MEVSMRKNSSSCCQIVYSQSFSLSELQESVVPDTLPDIAEILYTSANPLIRSKDISSGRARLEANVPARVTCAGEGDGTLFCIDVNIPFYLSAQDERIAEDSFCVVELMLRQVETRLLNPRKLSVRAELELRLCCYADGEVELPLAPEDSVAGVHALEESAEISVAACATEKTFVLTDESSLPDAMPSALELLAQSAEVSVQEIKALGSKVIASGIVRSGLLYRCESGLVHSVSFQTTFSQIIETECETEGAAVDLRMLLSGMYYEIIPGSDGREFAMELHLVAQTVVMENRAVTYLADAYSNAFPLELQYDERSFNRIEREAMLREPMLVSLETPGPVESVCACSVQPIGAQSDGGSICVTLRIVLCYSGGEGMRTLSRVVTKTMDAALGAQEQLQVSGVFAADVSAAPGGEGAEIRFTLEARGFVAAEVALHCVSAMRYDESAMVDTDALPSLVILKVDGRKSLWELAKSHCSTVEAILASNPAGDAPEAQEKLLMIPKVP